MTKFHFSFLIFHFLFAVSTASAEEPVKISAQHLEYIEKTDTYIARGSVKIVHADAVLNTDEAHLNNTTRDATAQGNVIYEDPEVIIRAERIEMNLDTKLGTFYRAYIFHKSLNYHIEGDEVKRLGEEIYYLNKATATTCDARPPEWCFRGRDVKITLHENVKAKDVTFHIRGVPVLYTPYFWAPLTEERQTGLLIPTVGYSDTKGFIHKQGFFWAIEENRDATFYLDYYSRKGFGKGLDYRYIEGKETSGELWIYHLRDNDLNRDFLEVKSYHNQKLPYGMSGNLKLHLTNKFDYYRVLGSTSAERFGLSAWKKTDPYGFGPEDRLQKYLESNLQISKPFYRGRAYLLLKYRQSTEGPSDEILQYLPEARLSLNSRPAGPLSFNMDVTGTNFWRRHGQHGQRFDIYPNVYLSLGKTLSFVQKVGVRETLYFLKEPAPNKNPTREIFDLKSSLTTKFFRKYPSFIHTIEPLLEYVYIPMVSHRDIPQFDSIDSMPQTSSIIYTLTNRFSPYDSGTLEARVKLSQSRSLLYKDRDRPFKPLVGEGGVSVKQFNLSINASYDVYDDRITEAISSLSLRGEKAFVGIGKNYRRNPQLDQYTIEAGIGGPLNIYGKSIPVDLYGKLRYDLKGGGAQELNLKTTYKSQCWGIGISYIGIWKETLQKKPFEYQIMFSIDFRGFGAIKI